MIRGILASVAASCLFGILFILPGWLQPLTGEEIFGWRILLTLPLLTVALRVTGESAQIGETWRAVRARPMLIGVLLVSAAILGVQQWLFTWAPTHGHALNVALAYFLMPLGMVVMGTLVFRERMGRLRSIAVGFATLGVINEVLRAGGLAWTTLVPALGFPLYFALRRSAKTATTGAMWFELLLMTPVAAWFVLTGPHLGITAQKLGPILMLGLVGGTALLLYLLASQRLPFNLFGMLSYLEPVLLVLVSLFVLRATLSTKEWFTYVPIWIAVGLLAAEGAGALRRPKGHA